MLDATAGNRMLWRKNKFNKNTIFIDIKHNLKISPDVIADNRFCPFRDDVFECIIYDPPHWFDYGTPAPYWDKPNENYYGYDDDRLGGKARRQKLLVSIIKAQKEFERLTSRLCFKWTDNPRTISIWNMIPLFKNWREVGRLKKPRPSKSTTYWITFVRSID